MNGYRKMELKQKPCPVCGRSIEYLAGFEPRTCYRARCRLTFMTNFRPETWAVNKKQPGPDYLGPSVKE
jgi:hypothetical protein